MHGHGHGVVFHSCSFYSCGGGLVALLVLVPVWIAASVCSSERVEWTPDRSARLPGTCVSQARHVPPAPRAGHAPDGAGGSKRELPFRVQARDRRGLPHMR